MEPRDFTFAFQLEQVASFEEYLELLKRQQRVPNPGSVANTFLVAALGVMIVGRVSISHVLDDALRREGGHIGYGVLPGSSGTGSTRPRQ